MTITIHTAKRIFEKSDNPIKRSRVYGRNNINNYILLEPVSVVLSNKKEITIPKGYVWDLASVPRLLWSLVPPDSDAELAFLIHDYLYENHKILNYDQKFCDNELKMWSKILNGTENKISLRNIDNSIRYYAVRLFGKKVFNR